MILVTGATGNVGAELGYYPQFLAHLMEYTHKNPHSQSGANSMSVKLGRLRYMEQTENVTGAFRLTGRSRLMPVKLGRIAPI